MTRLKSDNEQRQAAINEAREQLYSDYRATFGTDHGRRVLNDLKKLCFWKRSTINGNPFLMASNEGMRNVILYIGAKITDKPEPPQVMADEGEETV